MSDTHTSSGGPATASPADPLAYTLAHLSLRLWLAMRAIATGLEKYAGREKAQVPLLDEFGQQDINGAMVTVEKKVYGLSYYNGIVPSLRTKFAAEPLMPGWLLGAYSAALGPVLILLGITLLLGLGSRLTLFTMGLVYTSLSFGLVLINESAGVAWLAIHVILVVMALFTVRHDRFCLSRRF